jgi:hypothetical protein
MSEELSHFDPWITEGGPSALVMKEYLEPAAGPGEVIFPPTFAPPEDKKDEGAGYVIDGEGETAVCLIDSVGSQANRLEPIFKSAAYRDLVPQIEIRVKEAWSISWMPATVQLTRKCGPRSSRPNCEKHSRNVSPATLGHWRKLHLRAWFLEFGIRGNRNRNLPG